MEKIHEEIGYCKVSNLQVANICSEDTNEDTIDFDDFDD